MALDAELCYQAIVSRDRRFDGQFLVGVLPTGIYCRPGCPAPTPKRCNVRFFACAAAAEQAGLRPCKRCRPDAAPGSPAWMGTPATVTRALRLISEGALDGGDVGALAERLGVGERHLRRLFARLLGASPSAVAQSQRLHFARKLLEETQLGMSDVGFGAGFSSLRRFNDAFRGAFHATPSEFRRSIHNNKKSALRSVGRVRLRLPFRPPFDWAGLLGFLGPRAIPGVEQVTDRAYRRTVCVRGEPSIIEVSLAAREPYLVLETPATEPRQLSVLVQRARSLFDLDAEPLSIAAHLSIDPWMGAIVAERPGLRVPGTWDSFELAVRAVLGQQVSVKGATTLAGRIVQKYGRAVPGDGAGLTHLFPEPSLLAEANLEALGLTRSRSATIRALSQRAVQGELLEPTSDLEQQVAHLTEIAGIGPWTAHYILMRAGREPDAFPASDLGLRKSLSQGPKPASEAQAQRAAQPWRPWRAYAAMHLWALGTKN